MHVGDELLDEQGDFDADRLNTIGRMGGDDYVRTQRSIFAAAAKNRRDRDFYLE